MPNCLLFTHLGCLLWLYVKEKLRKVILWQIKRCQCILLEKFVYVFFNIKKNTISKMSPKLYTYTVHKLDTALRKYYTHFLLFITLNISWIKLISFRWRPYSRGCWIFRIACIATSWTMSSNCRRSGNSIVVIRSRLYQSLWISVKKFLVYYIYAAGVLLYSLWGAAKTYCDEKAIYCKPLIFLYELLRDYLPGFCMIFASPQPEIHSVSEKTAVSHKQINTQGMKLSLLFFTHCPIK